VTGYDGSEHWVQVPDAPASRVEDRTGAGREDGANLLHREIDIARTYGRMELRGSETIGDRRVYHISGAAADGSPVHLYFDLHTGLLVRRDQRQRAQVIQRSNGAVRAEIKLVDVEQYYDDYRDVDGVKVPFLVTGKSPSGFTTFRYDEILHDVPLDDGRFKRPPGK